MYRSSLWFARTLGVLATGFIALFFNIGTASAQRMVYHVNLDHISDHYVDVTLEPLDLRPDTMTFQMPAWYPGSYSEVHYGRFIHGFEALDSSGHELSVKHTRPDRWKITNSSGKNCTVAQIKYRVEDSHTDGSAPAAGLARIDDGGVFAYTGSIFGYLDDDQGIPATIIFDQPKGWKIATNLESVTVGETEGDARLKQNVFNMTDYGELTESPLVIQPDIKMAEFTLDGVPYTIVTSGVINFPIDSFEAAASHTIRAVTSFFPKAPYESYMFVVDAGSQHPLAVANEAASIYELPSITDWTAQGPEIERLIATTLFKTWNGKYFHLPQLGPIDFTTPVLAQSLWFTEGVSEYYGELLRVRYGLASPSEFFNAIDRWETEEEEASHVSLEALSAQMRHYDEARLEAMRARGALAAMMMDIEIRQKSHNKHSLDNVLARMDRDAVSGRTYDDKQLMNTVAKYSATDLNDFTTHYIASADTLPIEEFVERIGAGRVPTSMQGGQMGLNVALNTAGLAIITAPPAEALEADATLQKGDTIEAIDEKKVSKDIVKTAEKDITEGKTVKLTVLRGAKSMAVNLHAKKAKSTVRSSYASMTTASLEEIAMRKAMIGTRRLKRAKVKHTNYAAHEKVR